MIMLSFHRQHRQHHRPRLNLLWLVVVMIILCYHHVTVMVVRCFTHHPTSSIYLPNRQQRRRRQPFSPLMSLSSTSLRDASEGGGTTETTTIPFVIPNINVTIPRRQAQSEAPPTSSTTTSASSVRLKSPIRMPPPSTTSISSSSSTSVDNNNNNNNKMSKQNFIPTAELERLQASIDMVSLIELYDLPHFHKTNGGDRASCLCPFHDDTNPSLKIDNQRGLFKCFSCGVGGDAFKFVREYSKLHGHHELSFIETVRLFQDLLSPTSTGTESTRPTLPFDIKVPMGTRPPAAISAKVRKKVKRGDRSTIDNNTPMGDNATSDDDDQTNLERQQQTEQRKQRILLANLHAAAFYEECLFTLPAAGSARAHLRSRGINPHTVKAFAMGFAPESYFTMQQRQQYGTGPVDRPTWGEGSLVNHLRDRGFTPGEILDAGLAVRTKWGRRVVSDTSGVERNGNNDGEDTNHRNNDDDYSTLMDRFRGRLMIPIFDAAGSNILGFGGRILEASIATGSDFRAAKYLNSPESLVFLKKNILFGQHMAEKRTRFGRSTATLNNEADRDRSLLVVEGYMDAISLWQAGIRETVASMGTAITYEQLTGAAKAARKLNGRIVLCLDSDDAGVAAIDRLCTGQKPILVSATENLNVDIYVANLPEGIKDPADFLEHHRGSDGPERKFRVDVLQNATEWSEWYMNRLVASHIEDSGSKEKESFNAIFDCVASFLSTFEKKEDLAKRASLVAPKLANLVNAYNNTGTLTASSTVLSHLESELIEKANNMARSKSVVFPTGGYDRTVGLWKPELAIPKSLEISVDISLMNEGPGKQATSSDSYRTGSVVPELIGTDQSVEAGGKRYPKMPSRRRRTSLKRPVVSRTGQKTMTKHVVGLTSNLFDEKWMGVKKNMYGKESNHLGYELRVQGRKSVATTKSIGPDTKVRFNTNQYHGTWATMDARLAGYRATIFPKDSDFLTKGTSSLIQPNEEQMSTFVEDVLLRTLVLFPTARKSLSESIRVIDALGSHGTVKWSAPEKAWLFNCLVDSTEDSKQPDDVQELRSFLLTRPDKIPGALSEGSAHGNGLRSVSVEGSNEESQVATDMKSLDTVDTVVVSVGRDGISSGDASQHDEYWHDTDESGVEPVPELDNIRIHQSSRVSIPEIVGDEFSDFHDMDDFIPSLFADEGEAVAFEDDPQLLDVNSFQGVNETQESPASRINSPSNSANPPTAIEPQRIDGNASAITADFLEADFVVSRIAMSGEELSERWGVLDRFFVTEDVKELDIFTKPYAEIDWQESGSNDVKAGWAVQDLYAMLQFTSALHRVGTAKTHILAESSKRLVLEGKEMPMEAGTRNNDNKPVDKDFEDGLRRDLNSIRALSRGNRRAIERIYSLIEAQFSDTSMLTRGYSWLCKVLEFNQRKLDTWTTIVEQRDGFFSSDMRLEELESSVATEWNELSEDGEMWDWNNVNDSHESFIASNIRELGVEESNEVLEQIESDWGWVIGDEADDSDDYVESAVDEGEDDIEEERVTDDEGYSQFDFEDGWVDQENGDYWE